MIRGFSAFLLLVFHASSSSHAAALDQQDGPAAANAASCERVVQAGRQGTVTAADFAEEPSCRRVLVTRGDERLAVTLARLEMADGERLVVELNGQRHEFGPGHACERCLPRLVTAKLSLMLAPALVNASSSSSTSTVSVDDPSSQPVREKSLGEVLALNKTNEKVRVHSNIFFFIILFNQFQFQSSFL
jgi:hypothetical protein